MTARVLVAPPEVHAWFPQHEIAVSSGIGYQHACHRIKAALIYLWRPQPWLVTVLEDNIRASIPDWFNPQTAVGMPVRASDKCHGHDLGHSARGEMHCITFEGLMDVANSARVMDRTLDTLIFTTEDPKLVQEVRTFNDKQPADKKWKMVYNVRDVMQGTGSASAVAITTKGVTSTQKVLESALTSMHLQLRARVLLMRYTTSWNLCAKTLFDSDMVTYAADRLVFGYDHIAGDTARNTFTNFRC